MGISGSDFPPFGGFSNWEQWSNIASVFSVFIAGGLIPLTLYLNKKIKSMRDYNTKRKNDNIKEIATKVSDVVENKLNLKIEQQSQAIESISKTMEKLSEKLDHQDKQNKAILSTIRRLTSDFHNFKDEQIRVNAKVDYVDNIFRNYITFNGKPDNND